MDLNIYKVFFSQKRLDFVSMFTSINFMTKIVICLFNWIKLPESIFGKILFL